MTNKDHMLIAEALNTAARQIREQSNNINVIDIFTAITFALCNVLQVDSATFNIDLFLAACVLDDESGIEV